MENVLSQRFRNVIAVLLIVAAAIAAAALYNMRQRAHLSSTAKTWASEFIRSSPVVEQQLGRVEALKEVEEQERGGKTPGWYLDYDVSGRHRDGVVTMRLTPNLNGGWNVPLAEVETDHAKPINLR